MIVVVGMWLVPFSCTFATGERGVAVGSYLRSLDHTVLQLEYDETAAAPEMLGDPHRVV